MPKFEKTAGFWRDRNLCHVRQPHCPRKFFSTLENLLSRDIVSICFYSHILMKSAVRQGIQDIVRSLSLLPVSATLKTEIYVPKSQAADCLEFLAMFWKCSNTPLPSSKDPHFQNEARCTIFLAKMSFICIADHLPSFWNRGPENSEMAYYRYCLSWSSSSLWLLLTHPSSLLFLISRVFSS